MELQKVTIPEKMTFDEGEINPLDLLIALMKRKRMIAAITFAIPLITLIITFIVTPKYQGLSRILVSQSSSAASAMLSQLASSGAAGLLGDVSSLTGGSPVEMYVGLTQSRTVCDAIIERFGLLQFYKNDRFLGKWRSYTADDARLDFLDHLVVESDSASGIISISVLDPNPQKSSDMTNAVVAELQQLVNKLATTAAGRRRIYFEEQLGKSFQGLTKAEESLQGFQETTGAIQIDEQAKATLQGIAMLEAQRAAKEIQLRVLKTYAAESNPDYKRTEEELKALSEQLKKLELQGGTATGTSNPIIPTAQIPNLGAEYLRKLREFKFQEALYEILLKQYTAARLEEAKEASVIQLVDSSVVPEIVYSPKKLIWTAIAGVLGFFIAIGVALLMGLVEKMSQNPLHKEKMEELAHSLKRI